jgi:hypothetical protein
MQERDIVTTLHWEMVPCNPHMYAEQFCLRMDFWTPTEIQRIQRGAAMLIDVAYTGASRISFLITIGHLHKKYCIASIDSRLVPFGPAIVAAASIAATVALLVQKGKLHALPQHHSTHFGLTQHFPQSKWVSQGGQEFLPAIFCLCRIVFFVSELH